MNGRVPIDPFSLKGLAKYNPRRVFYTFAFRCHDLKARLLFAGYALPSVKPAPRLPPETTVSPCPAETTVTAEQWTVLAASLRLTEQIPDPCVEIGSYRGETTRFLAMQTGRKVIAVDPYFRGEPHMEEFRRKTGGLRNVSHLRLASGQAAPRITSASFVFIDAVHSYADVRFDLASYAPKIVVGGVMALHDTDNRQFAGSRRAVYEFSRTFSQFCLRFHVHDLVVFQRQ